jgi:hypothetical protein
MRGLLGVSTRTSAGFWAKASSSALSSPWSTKAAREMALVAPRRDQPIGAAVAIMWRDQEVVSPQRREHEVDGRHAGRDDDRSRPAFELGDRVGEEIAARIAQARVVKGARPLEPFKREGGGEDQRWGDGPEGHIGRDPIRNRDGLASSALGHNPP